MKKKCLCGCLAALILFHIFFVKIFHYLIMLLRKNYLYSIFFFLSFFFFFSSVPIFFYLPKEMGVSASFRCRARLLEMILQDNRKLFSPENGSWSAYCRFHLFKRGRKVSPVAASVRI